MRRRPRAIRGDGKSRSTANAISDDAWRRIEKSPARPRARTIAVKASASPRSLATAHLFTAAEFMALDLDERTELLEGLIYEVSPRNEPQRYAVSKLLRALTLGLDPGYIVRSQDAVAIAGRHGREAPEVDVAVLRDEYYPTAPTAGDALALVEVSDTSYRLDRDYKIPLYVNAGVPSWIVSIPERRIEYYGRSSDLDAAHGVTFFDGDSIVVAGVRIGVSEIFPRLA